VIAVTLGGLVTYRYATMPDPPPGPTKANFERLAVGMTRQRAEAVLGGPGDPSGERLRGQFVNSYYWTAPGVRIGVYFTNDDLVEDAVYLGNGGTGRLRRPFSLLEWITALLYL
jgi:hypothetical protein